jgi:hypothetical protein
MPEPKKTENRYIEIDDPNSELPQEESELQKHVAEQMPGGKKLNDYANRFAKWVMEHSETMREAEKQRLEAKAHPERYNHTELPIGPMPSVASRKTDKEIAQIEAQMAREIEVQRALDNAKAINEKIKYQKLAEGPEGSYVSPRRR